jgi:ribonuclease D
MIETLYIHEDRALGRLCERLRGAERIAVDTEFLRERTYYPKLCLLQIATSDVMAMVDPLGCSDLQPLWDTLLGGAEIVLHAATQDLEIVQRHAGRLPERVFDTQVAAAFLGIGDSIGYSKLVDRLTGQSPGRSEAYTDWSVRPLTQQQLDYALDDVRWLLECQDKLSHRLRELGREAWVREELDTALQAIAHTPDAFEQWRRVSGARGLGARHLPVLREVVAWREQEAVRRDIPRQRVVPDRVLVEIARRSPSNVDQLRKLRGMHTREADRSGSTILRAVERGQQVPEPEWPSWPRTAAKATAPNVDALASLLDAVMRTLALDLELSSRLLGTRSDLEKLVRLELAGVLDEEGPRELAVMSGWRHDVAGHRLAAVLRGEVAARVTAAPGGLHLTCE